MSAITPDKCQNKQFFMQIHILLLKVFNHMLKDLVPCAVNVCRFCSEVQVCCLLYCARVLIFSC